MRLELRGKVLALTLATAFAAVILAVLILNILLARGFAGYVRKAEEDRAQAAVAALADYYRQNHSWAGAQRVVLPGFLMFVTDADNKPIMGRPFPGRGMMRGFGAALERKTIRVDGLIAGYAYFRFPRLIWSTGAEQQLRAGMNRAFLIAGISAALLAILLGLYFARRLTDPIRRIEDAARAMAGGDLDRRAEVGGRDELAHLAETLNALAWRTKDLLAERRRLAADLAHELRTPLAVIKSLNEAFADGVLPADAEHLAQVEEEIDRLQGLAERIPEAFLAEDRAAAPRTVIILNSLLADLIHRFSLRFRDKDIRLAQDVPREPIAVLGDREALVCALSNLLDNALKYAPSGSEVSVTLYRDGSQAAIDLADQGPGIAPEHLPHIFDRLYRADPSRSRQTGGYGLGLAIARGIVDAHGELVAVNAPGRGAVFTLRLPILERK